MRIGNFATDRLNDQQGAHDLLGDTSCCTPMLTRCAVEVSGNFNLMNQLLPLTTLQIERRDYEGMLRASQAQGRGARSGGGAMAGADA